MTLAEITRSPTRRAKSAGEFMAGLDVRKLAGLVVWIVFLVLLIVLG